MAKRPNVELLDALVIADDAARRLVEKIFRVSGGLSYDEAVALALDAGWEGEPAGQHTSTARRSRSWATGDMWTVAIDFTTDKERLS